MKASMQHCLFLLQKYTTVAHIRCENVCFLLFQSSPANSNVYQYALNCQKITPISIILLQSNLNEIT